MYLEGFDSRAEFLDAFEEMYGKRHRVWVFDFEVVEPDYLGPLFAVDRVIETGQISHLTAPAR